MKESYIVYNASHSAVSCYVQRQVFDIDPETLPKYKRRKATRGTRVAISVKPQQSLDLVEFSGLTVADLEQCADLQKLIGLGKIHKQSVTYIEEIPDEVVDAPEPAPEPEEEEEVTKDIKLPKKVSKDKPASKKSSGTTSKKKDDK